MNLPKSNVREDLFGTTKTDFVEVVGRLPPSIICDGVKCVFFINNIVKALYDRLRLKGCRFILIFDEVQHAFSAESISTGSFIARLSKEICDIASKADCGSIL